LLKASRLEEKVFPGVENSKRVYRKGSEMFLIQNAVRGCISRGSAFVSKPLQLPVTEMEYWWPRSPLVRMGFKSEVAQAKSTKQKITGVPKSLFNWWFLALVSRTRDWMNRCNKAREQLDYSQMRCATIACGSGAVSLGNNIYTYLTTEYGVAYKTTDGRRCGGEEERRSVNSLLPRTEPLLDYFSQLKVF
jgi:hypothetical protein